MKRASGGGRGGGGGGGSLGLGRSQFAGFGHIHSQSKPPKKAVTNCSLIAAFSGAPQEACFRATTGNVELI